MVTSSSSAGWNRGLWVVQILLGAVFLMAGVPKIAMPMLEFVKMNAWAVDMSEALVRFIGVSELAGGVGLILPAATKTLPILTPIAGAALALVMLLAAGLHMSRGEPQFIVVNVVLGGLALFIAWGRLKKVPIAPR
jgi:uncharacterized membrane protein YphA (DoxX/SURF4 family)